MKTHVHIKNGLLAALGLLMTPVLWAQQAIPNGGFENWDVKTVRTLTNYITSELENGDDGAGTAVRVSDAQNGQYAIKLTTILNSGNEDPTTGFFVNFMVDDNLPNEWHGGIPYNEKPTGIKGYYKCDVKDSDSAFILLVFSKNGQNIGTYYFMFGGKQTNYTLFEFTLNPPLPQTPDSLIFGGASSNILFGTPINGSMLQLDNVSLTGVTNQPTMFNGDFEKWTDINFETPSKWYSETDEWLFPTVKTTDKFKGDYAVKLVSYLDADENNQKRINGSEISTGYYTPFGVGGGYPFTGMNDTLSFWYKYETNGNSRAEVRWAVKKDGNIIGGREMELGVQKGTFRNVLMPMDASFGGPPDTLIVFFSSLGREYESNLDNEGATLIVDEVELKSQRLNTGLRSNWSLSNVKVYPNPAQEFLNITIPEADLAGNTTIAIVNQLGQEVLRAELKAANEQISVSNLAAGIYTYSIANAERTLKTGKIYIK